MTKKINTRFIVISSIIVLAALSRLIPHIPNFTPIAAIALFGAATYKNKITAFAIPLAAMFLSDLLLGFHSGMIVVYLSFILIGMIGLTLSKKQSPLRILGATVASSVLFFVLTNFAVWYGYGMYSHDLTGLTTCYGMALPFFRNSILGDLFYSTILFGGFYLVQLKFPALQAIKSESKK